MPRTARYQRLGEKQSRACQRLCPQGLLLKQRFGAGFFGSATCGVRPNSYDRPTKEGPQPHPKTPALRAMPPLRRQCSQPPPGLKARGAAFCALHNIWGFEHEAGPATKEDREPRRRAVRFIVRAPAPLRRTPAPSRVSPLLMLYLTVYLPSILYLYPISKCGVKRVHNPPHVVEKWEKRRLRTLRVRG